MKRRFRTHRNFTARSAAYAAILAVGLGGMGATAFRMIGKLTPDAFNCFDAFGPPPVRVLFDASEPRFNEEQARSLRNYFARLYHDLAFNQRLEVYTTGEAEIASVTTPSFRVCGGARSPEELESINAFTAEPGYLAKERERIYEKVFMPEIESLLDLAPGDDRRQTRQSPMLELMRDLSGDIPQGTRLIIISDLINNSDSARFCVVQNDMPPFAAFKERTVYQSRLKPRSLSGVDVEVLLLQRVGYGQTPLPYCKSEEEIVTFWRDYLVDNGVSDPTFVRIRHGYTG